MTLSFCEFVHLGREQWREQSGPLAALFLRAVGPLGTHARIRNAHVLNKIEGWPLDGCHALDFGSGHGYTLFALARRHPGASFEGLEQEAGQVAACRRGAQAEGLRNLRFQQGGGDEIPAQPKYDMIISIDVLEHVPDDLGLLRRMAGALRPGGRLVIHVPLRHQLQRRLIPAFRAHTVHDHVRDEYTSEEISARLREAGMQVASAGWTFGFWGELSFELNNLFWRHRLLRNLCALCTLPLALVTGYLDTRRPLTSGNGILVVASRREEELSHA